MLELKNITKRFGDVLANDNVNIVVKPGTIHAIVGENGAGKSTAMRIAYGFYTADSGEILVDGKPVDIKSPHDAIALGIGMVHQHFMLVETMTVAENIVLGAEPGTNLALDLKSAGAQIRQLSEEFKLAVNPNEPIEHLSVGQQQRVELLKALYRHARILILDEPTAVLTPLEVEEFFVILRRMREQGKTVIIITHKLSEVLAISDEVTVMRDGKVVGGVQTKDTNAAELARLMVGREVLLRVAKSEPQVGKTKLEVKNLTVTDINGAKRVNDVSFEVRSGEIVGIAGVEGNGQTELIEALAGLRKISGGEIHFEERPIAFWKYPTGPALRNLLLTYGVLLLLEAAFTLMMRWSGNVHFSVPIFAPISVLPRLLIQLIVIWFLIRALKKGASWACYAVAILSILGLASLAAFIYSYGFSGAILFAAIFNGIFFVAGVVLALKTLRDFNRHEKSELEAPSVRETREFGIAHIPEDRHRRGLLLDFSLAENSILGVHYLRPVTAGGVFLDGNAIQRRAAEIIQGFDVRPPNAALPARALSGGNQQKLIIGREYKVDPKLLLVSQPTRGVDIGAIEFIHRQLVGLRDDGCAILLVSAELEEVTSLSDRLLIIHDGRIAGEVDPKVATLEEIGLLMTRGH